jgi:hypothetical protein
LLLKATPLNDWVNRPAADAPQWAGTAGRFAFRLRDRHGAQAGEEVRGRLDFTVKVGASA